MWQVVHADRRRWDTQSKLSSGPATVRQGRAEAVVWRLREHGAREGTSCSKSLVPAGRSARHRRPVVQSAGSLGGCSRVFGRPAQAPVARTSRCNFSDDDSLSSWSVGSCGRHRRRGRAGLVPRRGMQSRSWFPDRSATCSGPDQNRKVEELPSIPIFPILTPRLPFERDCSNPSHGSLRHSFRRGLVGG